MDKTFKTRVSTNLENWYSIDSILFNGHARNIIREGSAYREYCVLKAGLLSNLFEYWNHVGYKPKNRVIPNTVKTLQESAVNTAKKSKMLASDMLSKNSVKTSLKNYIISESTSRNITDLDSFQGKIIHEKFMQISLDNCLIGIPLLESESINSTCSFECQILEKAHKMNRDAIVRLALTCEKVDDSGTLQEGFIVHAVGRKYNRDKTDTTYGIKKAVRHSNPLNISNSLRTTMANAARKVSRIGTGRNSDLKIGVLRLKQAVSAGKITSASQYERALADLYKRHGLEPSKAQVGTRNARDVRNARNS